MSRAGIYPWIGLAAGMAAGQYFDRKPMFAKLSEAGLILGIVGAVSGYAFARTQDAGALAAASGAPVGAS